MKRAWVYLTGLLVLAGLVTWVFWGSSPTQNAESDRRALRGLGYTGAYEEAPDRRGVVVHEPDSVYPGLTLYVSEGETAARLIDLSGEVVHRWEVPYKEVFGESMTADTMHEGPKKDSPRGLQVEPDGDLIFFYHHQGVAKVDKDGRPIWTTKMHPHHDLKLGKGGRIYVGTRHVLIKKQGCPHNNALDDAITVMSPQGEVLETYRVSEALEESKYEGLLAVIGPTDCEAFHANDFALVPADHYLSRQYDADILLSLRQQSSLIAIDTHARTVTWAMTGRTTKQHEPTFLPNGEVLVFDNATIAGRSRIVAFDPETRAQTWSWSREDFFSTCCGTVQRLPNGNTLIAETGGGRIIEVTPSGRTAWEFVNPRDASDTEIDPIESADRYPREYFDFL